jgi:transcriptional regulator with XRE-family HTH domain
LTRTADGDLPEHQSRQVAARIREALARRRISRQRLADDAKISISTLEKALAGSRPFTLGTLVRIEQALGMSLRPAEAPVAAEAPESLGS